MEAGWRQREPFALAGARTSFDECVRIAAKCKSRARDRKKSKIQAGGGLRRIWLPGLADSEDWDRGPGKARRSPGQTVSQPPTFAQFQPHGYGSACTRNGCAFRGPIHRV